MAKEAFYFSHDTGARNDPKLQKVLMKLGHAGKSVFWDLVEMLHEEGGYLMLSECENYAFALRTDINCITSLINDFNLFNNDGVRFWSESALRRIEQREMKSKKAAESAYSRWKNANAQKNDANALQPESDGNAIKERKGNKIKENIVSADKSAAFIKKRDDFYEELKTYVPQYSKELLRGFFNYWSELNKSGTKMRFELERTWETSKRLATWASREKVEANKTENVDIKGGRKILTPTH